MYTMIITYNNDDNDNDNEHNTTTTTTNNNNNMYMWNLLGWHNLRYFDLQKKHQLLHSSISTIISIHTMHYLYNHIAIIIIMTINLIIDIIIDIIMLSIVIIISMYNDNHAIITNYCYHCFNYYYYYYYYYSSSSSSFYYYL